MKYKLFIFDLDGTILDTLDDLSDSVNYALSVVGFPARTVDEVRVFVGNGIRKLIERAVPMGTPKEKTDMVFEKFKEYYGKNCANKTRPYKGIREMLLKLKNAGIKIAVLSNKADFAVKILCDKYFNDMFDAAYGAREGVNKKPSPDAVFEILNELGIDKKDAVYVGDSEVDIETANNAGMDMIIVDWGFRERALLEQKGAGVIVSAADEFLGLIGL
ncbi:MAG: HAD family hydrolase [Lachnospiraceae bacterium]